MSVPSIEDAYRLNQVIQGSPDATGISSEWAGVAAAMLQCNGNGDRSQAFMDAIKDMEDFPQILKVVVANRQPGGSVQPFRLYTATEMALLPPPKWLIRGVMTAGAFVEKVGDPGSMKSFAALDMGACIAGGLEWHGLKVQQGSVIYVLGEGVGSIGPRIRAWEILNRRSIPAELQFIREAVIFGQDMRNPSVISEDVERFRATIDRMNQPPALAIFDTLARMMGSGDENSTRDMGALIKAVDGVRADYGTTMDFIHHFNKVGRTRGSSALLGAIDTEITFKYAKPLVTMECTKQKDFAPFRPMTFRANVMELGQDDEGYEHSSVALSLADTPTISSVTLKSFDILREIFGREGASATRWEQAAEEHGIPHTTWARTRTELVEGLKSVTRVGNRYLPTEYAT